MRTGLIRSSVQGVDLVDSKRVASVAAGATVILWIEQEQPW
jgi:hypothetical protein